MLRLKQNLAIVGGIVVCHYAYHYAYQTLQTISKLIPSYNQNLFDNFAIVTGGASGIGLAFAIELANQNFNLVLIDKDQNALKNAKTEIKSKNRKIQVILLEIDFIQVDQSTIYQNIYKTIENLDLAILVNNVGMMTPQFLQYFHLQTEQEISNVMTVNMFPTVFLTQLILKQMVQRKQKSAVINLSSATALKSMPFNSIYCASKTFVNFFSQAIAYEYRNQIDIIALTPNNVASSMTGVQPSFQNLTPEECAKGCLRYLGKSIITDGNIRHLFQFAFIFNNNSSYFNSKIRRMTMDAVNNRMYSAYCRINKIENKQEEQKITKKLMNLVISPFRILFN